MPVGQSRDNGFDDARLDTLFLAMPISWKGTLQQYVGRLHRLHDGKRLVQVYDYVDNYIPMLSMLPSGTSSSKKTASAPKSTGELGQLPLIADHLPIYNSPSGWY